MSYLSSAAKFVLRASASLLFILLLAGGLQAEDAPIDSWLKGATDLVKEGAKKAEQAKEAAKQAVQSVEALFPKLEGNDGLQFTLGIAYGLQNGVTEDIELATDIAKFGKAAFDRALKLNKEDWAKAPRDAFEAVRGNLPKLMEATEKQAQEFNKYVMDLAKEAGNVKVEINMERAWLIASSSGAKLFEAVSSANPAEGLENIFSGKWAENLNNVPPEMIDAVETAAFFIYLSYQTVAAKWQQLSWFEKGAVTGLIIYAVAPWQRVAGAAKSKVEKMRDALKIRGKRGKNVAIGFEDVAAAVKRRETLGAALKFCVLFGTVVMCESGQQPIERLVIGDFVRAPVNGVEQVCRVIGVSSCVSYRIIDIHYATDSGASGFISLTPEHRVWCENLQQWSPSSSLIQGDRLSLSAGKFATITKTMERKSEEGFRVADISIEDAHSFYVGTDHVLIHNVDPPLRNCERMTDLFQSSLEKRRGNLDLSPNDKKDFSPEEKTIVWESFQEAFGKLRPPGTGKVNSLTVQERIDFYKSISKNYYKGELIDPPTSFFKNGKLPNLPGTNWNHWFPRHLRRADDGGNYSNGLVTRMGTPEAHTGGPNGVDIVIDQRIRALRDSVPSIPANKTPHQWFMEQDLNYRSDFLEKVYKEEFSMKFPRDKIIPGGNW